MARSNDDQEKGASSSSSESNEPLEVKVTLSGRISVDPVEVLRSDSMDQTLKILEKFKVREQG